MISYATSIQSIGQGKTAPLMPSLLYRFKNRCEFRLINHLQQESTMLLQLQKVSQEQALSSSKKGKKGKKGSIASSPAIVEKVKDGGSGLFSSEILSKYLGFEEMPEDVDIVEASVGKDWLSDLRLSSSLFGQGSPETDISTESSSSHASDPTFTLKKIKKKKGILKVKKLIPPRTKPPDKH
jgi:hypothetical protein